MMVDAVIKQEVKEPREVILTWKEQKPKENIKLWVIFDAAAAKVLFLLKYNCSKLILLNSIYA